MARQVRVDAGQMAQKWGTNLKGAAQYIRDGVSRVTESPMEKAAEQIDKMQANFNESVRSGKVLRGLRRRTLAEWKERTMEVGIGRIAAGVDKAMDDMRDFAGQLIAHENSLLGVIDRMPDVSLEDSISRATAWIRGMAEFVRD